MFHNEYGAQGGEDVSAWMDTTLLRQRGVDVCEYRVNNRDALDASLREATLTLWRSHFNRRVYDSVRAFCRQHRPQVGHVQNFWFALSPSVHAACHAEGVATVQTLRNYRLLCVNACLIRKGLPCEDCVGKAPWRGIVRACYRRSWAQSALVARMIQYNRWRATWQRDVDVFVSLTPFARDRYVAGGLPPERMVIRPNSVLDPGDVRPLGTGAIFVGRLSEEKGIDVLLSGWERLPETSLAVVGDGPLRGAVEDAAGRSTHVRFLGALPAHEVLDRIREAAFLVMTSRWYEGFPRVLVEAFALGRPVIAPRLGSMADIVRHGVTGLLYDPGSVADLVRCAKELAHDRSRLEEMSKAARAEYESSYAPEVNARQLFRIYEQALHLHSQRNRAKS